MVLFILDVVMDLYVNPFLLSASIATCFTKIDCTLHSIAVKQLTYRDPYLHKGAHVELMTGNSLSMRSPNIYGTSTEKMMVYNLPFVHAHIGTN